MEKTSPNLYKLQILIGVSSLVRLVLAFSFDFGNDEVYYWTYSHFLQWNYFDHPPMISFLIRVFTLNNHWESLEGIVRLPSILAAALSTYFIYKITAGIKDEKSGLVAAYLYTVSFYGSVIAGIMVMPDSPQMVFWTLSLWLICLILKDDRNWILWISFGISTGLCIMSKVHGVFLWSGLGLFTLIYRRDLWKYPQIYISFLLTLILISPIFIWNWENNFITYRYHSARVSLFGFHLEPVFFLRELLGQWTYNNPILVLTTLFALIRISTIFKIKIPAPILLFNLIGIPMAGFILFVSLFRETLPHWTGPAYISLLPLTAIYLVEVLPKLYMILIRWALRILVFFLVLLVLVVNYYPGPLIPDPKPNTPYLGESDITLDLYGWKKAGHYFQNFIQKREKSKMGKKPLVIQKWFPGAHLSYYFAREIHMPVVGLGNVNNLHEFLWYNTELIHQKPDFTMDTSFTIIPSNLIIQTRAEFGDYYQKIQEIGSYTSMRGNFIMGKKPVRVFKIFELTGWKGQIPFIIPHSVL